MAEKTPAEEALIVAAIAWARIPPSHDRKLQDAEDVLMERIAAVKQERQP